MRRMLAAGLLVLVAAATTGAQMPKYGVMTRIDEHTDFSRFTTYAWEDGWLAYDRDLHAQIVAAVDSELTARGLTKTTTEDCDVTVVYATLHRTDVDLKAKHSPMGLYPTYPVTTLVVLVRDPQTHKELYRARADTREGLEPDRIGDTIKSEVARMFEDYPSRHSK